MAWSFAETVTLIGVLTTSTVSIITAFRVSTVHTLVNRNFSEQKQEISMLRGQLIAERIAATLGESTRRVLAEEAAKQLATAQAVTAPVAAILLEPMKEKPNT
jgi:hypothetical protein